MATNEVEVRFSAAEITGIIDRVLDGIHFVTPEQLVKLLREEFYEATGRKTGWGNVELKLEFERCVSNTLARCVVFRTDGKNAPEHLR
jgi:hypothetical protein